MSTKHTVDEIMQVVSVVDEKIAYIQQLNKTPDPAAPPMSYLLEDVRILTTQIINDK